MQQLYSDLISTDPAALLDLSRPAFKFISQERYDSCKWSEDILTSLENAISVHKDEVTKGIGLMLPKLAEGWHRQRANVWIW